MGKNTVTVNSSIIIHANKIENKNAFKVKTVALNF